MGSGFDNNVVVLGGVSDNEENVLKSTEIYRADVNNWEIGPDFPTTIYGVAMVQYDSDTILALGGATELAGQAAPQIYSLTKSNMAEWVKIGRTTLARYANVALSVPRQNLPGCKKMSHDHEVLDEMIDL